LVKDRGRLVLDRRASAPVCERDRVVEKLRSPTVVAGGCTGEQHFSVVEVCAGEEELCPDVLADLRRRGEAPSASW
jgi:hypothetical protein